MQYSTERKEAVLRKMVPPYNRSIKQLAREEGISEATLFNWRSKAREKGLLLHFIENHDEPWAAVAFSKNRLRAAAVVAFTLPG